MTSTDKKKIKKKMVNITINLPEIYDQNIKKLIGMKICASRSEAIRTALRDFLHNEYNNLKLLGFFGEGS
ncbi:MAG: CopG family transcriptional regulator [Promethearchaeota archaeon Loki_b32]|nr:MAG: CopG family transcriptional regulator [Candidatus Lokiarchaeota archaeon Loki_b32]